MPLARTLLTAALALLAGGDGVPPLTNEDVVRMLVAGTPVPEILEAIASKPVHFDLEEDMVEELRLAGVPEEILRAMADRQSRIERERAAAAGGEVAAPTLTVRLAAAPEEPPPALVVPARLGDELARALEIEAGTGRTVDDAAVFAACRTPEHVPDYWRSRSPLGRDFVSMPRHRMLAFHPGALAAQRRDLPRRERRFCPATADGCLRLEVPRVLSAEPVPEPTHDIVLGVAIRAGDRYLRIASAERDDVAVGPDGAALDARVRNARGGRPFEIDVSFVEPDQSSRRETSLDTPRSSIVTP